MTSPPASTEVLKSILRYTAVLTAVVAAGAAGIGALVAGERGALSGVIGAAMTLVFLGITAASILLANRFAGSEVYLGAFFGIVLGGWLLKFLAFLVLIFLLKDQPFLHPTVLFLTVVIAVIGSLVVDAVVVARSRMPYVSDIALPPPTER